MKFFTPKECFFHPPLWLLAVLLLAGPVLAQGQVAPKLTVTGKVLDDAGQPVAGASVTIKGSRTAVTAGADGTFSIAAARNATLVISYVGFQDKEVKVAGINLGVISMVKGDKSMEDVVVIGYGTQKRQNVTAAVSTMDTKSIQERPITRFHQCRNGTAVCDRRVSFGCQQCQQCGWLLEWQPAQQPQPGRYREHPGVEGCGCGRYL